MRWQFHLEPAVERAAADEMSGLQKAGAQGLFRLQHTAQTQTVVGDGCEEGWF